MECVTLYGSDGRVFRSLEADSVDVGQHGPRHLVLRNGKDTTSILLAEGHTAIIEPVTAPVIVLPPESKQVMHVWKPGSVLPYITVCGIDGRTKVSIGSTVEDLAGFRFEDLAYEQNRLAVDCPDCLLMLGTSEVRG